MLLVRTVIMAVSCPLTGPMQAFWWKRIEWIMIVGVALATAQILCCLTTAHFHGTGLKTNSGPDPCSDFGAGIVSTFLFRSRDRTRKIDALGHHTWLMPHTAKYKLNILLLPHTFLWGGCTPHSPINMHCSCWREILQIVLHERFISTVFPWILPVGTINFRVD